MPQRDIEDFTSLSAPERQRKMVAAGDLQRSGLSFFKIRSP